MDAKGRGLKEVAAEVKKSSSGVDVRWRLRVLEVASAEEEPENERDWVNEGRASDIAST
jgi:hypothetical protein